MTSMTSPLSRQTWIGLRFVTGLIACFLLPIAIYAWNWTKSENAFGTVESGRISILRHAILGTSPQVQAVPEGAARITLPHLIDDFSSDRADYRLFFHLPENTRSTFNMALCVPRWSANARMWIDGQQILGDDTNRLDVKSLFRPALIALPLNLGPGEHRIDIQLRTLVGTLPGLSEVWFGQHHLVANECGTLEDIMVGSRIGGLMLMLFITLVSACVFAYQRDGLSLGFTVAGLSMCLHTLVALDWFGPMQDETWITWFMVTRPLSSFAGVFVALRVVKIRRAQMDWALLGLLLLSYAVFIALPRTHWHLWLIGVAFVMVPLTLALALYLLWYASTRSRYLSDYAFAICMIYGVSANAMDLGRAKGWLPYSILSMTHWVAPILALAIGLLVIERMVNYLQFKQRASTLLLEKLAEQKSQLADFHEEVRAQRERILLTEERQRLVREMHDGLGSQLVSASALIKSGPINASKSVELTHLIDLALLDLRSMLDVFSTPPISTQQDDQDAVSLLLAMLRHRLAPVFRAQGIVMVWQSDPLPHDFLKNDQDRLQLLRCLQEAYTNIIKHAVANTVTFRTQVSATHIVLEVKDDGHGIDASKSNDNKRSNHGLENMAARAQQIGAHFEIASSDRGTCIRLTFERPTPG